MRRCIDCGDYLTELDFGHHCLECSEAALIAPSQDPERFDPIVYLAPIRPDPRPWESDSDTRMDREGSGNSVRESVPTEAP